MNIIDFIIDKYWILIISTFIFALAYVIYYNKTRTRKPKEKKSKYPDFEMRL